MKSISIKISLDFVLQRSINNIGSENGWTPMVSLLTHIYLGFNGLKEDAYARNGQCLFKLYEQNFISIENKYNPIRKRILQSIYASYM